MHFEPFEAHELTVQASKLITIRTFGLDTMLESIDDLTLQSIRKSHFEN